MAKTPLHTSPQSVLCISSINVCPCKLFSIVTIILLSPYLRHFLDVTGWQKLGAFVSSYLFLSKISRSLPCLNDHHFHSRMSHCALCPMRISDQAHPWVAFDAKEPRRDNRGMAYRIQGSRCGFGSCYNLLAVRKLFLLGTGSRLGRWRICCWCQSELC